VKWVVSQKVKQVHCYCCLTPEPLGPTIPIVCPHFTEKEKLSRTNASGLAGYEKQTLSKQILSKFKEAADTDSVGNETIFRLFAMLVTNVGGAAAFFRCILHSGSELRSIKLTAGKHAVLALVKAWTAKENWGIPAAPKVLKQTNNYREDTSANASWTLIVVTYIPINAPIIFCPSGSQLVFRFSNAPDGSHPSFRTWEYSRYAPNNVRTP